MVYFSDTDPFWCFVKLNQKSSSWDFREIPNFVLGNLHLKIEILKKCFSHWIQNKIIHFWSICFQWTEYFWNSPTQIFKIKNENQLIFYIRVIWLDLIICIRTCMLICADCICCYLLKTLSSGSNLNNWCRKTQTLSTLGNPSWDF